MSFEYDTTNILGFWRNENFPPYQIDDNLEITLNLNDEFGTSLITIKNDSVYTNYALKFVSIQSDAFKSLAIKYKVLNGDNINLDIIGNEIVIGCSLFLGFPRTDTMICENEIFGKRLFKRK